MVDWVDELKFWYVYIGGVHILAYFVSLYGRFDALLVDWVDELKECYVDIGVFHTLAYL
jgi:hypothetical protein